MTTSLSSSSSRFVLVATTTSRIIQRKAIRCGALGSALGTDSSMIAANNRQTLFSISKTRMITTATKTTTNSTENITSKPTSFKTSPLLSYHFKRRMRMDSSMIAANHRHQLHQQSQQQQIRSFTNTTKPCMMMMKDEYGEMTDDGHTYIHPTPFTLENGTILPQVQLRYQTYGTLNEQTRDNVIVICHALTGNASLHSWWGDLLGPNKAFDTNKYFIVCCNILGSCYGSTGPQSINPNTGQPYGKDFPDISVQDTVRIQLEMLINELQISSIHTVIGGSFGGMQAMEFAVQAGSSYSVTTTNTAHQNKYYFNPKDSMTPLVRTVIPIACGASHTAWQIGISETQRQAIYADPNWSTNGLEATRGLAVARQIGMVSYRTPKGYRNKFGRQLQIQPSQSQQQEEESQSPPLYGSNAPWKVKSYLEYQGIKFLDRFDPITYVKMTEQMDSHDISRGRASTIQDVLQHIEIPIMVLGIDSDVLYPLEEQQELVKYLPNGELQIIHSDDGHDGFLLEQEQVAYWINKFLEIHK